MTLNALALIFLNSQGQMRLHASDCFLRMWAKKLKSAIQDSETPEPWGLATHRLNPPRMPLSPKWRTGL
jgi:hypothetical protein